MAKREDIHKKTQAKIAKILAEVPIDLHARLRQRYGELEPLKFEMSKKDRERFEEIGKIIERLNQATTATLPSIPWIGDWVVGGQVARGVEHGKTLKD
jgi:hypothetical protein